MPVSAKEKAHFEAIGRAMADEKALDRHDVSFSTPAERVRAGFLLGDVPRSPAIEIAIDENAMAQIGLARRRPLRA